jgi:hypothetical protein
MGAAFKVIIALQFREAEEEWFPSCGSEPSGCMGQSGNVAYWYMRQNHERCDEMVTTVQV